MKMIRYYPSIKTLIYRALNRLLRKLRLLLPGFFKNKTVILPYAFVQLRFFTYFFCLAPQICRSAKGLFKICSLKHHRTFLTQMFADFHGSQTSNGFPAQNYDSLGWRRERDLNPRGPFWRPTFLAGRRFRPLSHLSLKLE